MIEVKEKDGVFVQVDGERRVKLWTLASCFERVSKLLEDLPASDREAFEVIQAFWTKAVDYVRSKSDGDFFSFAEANNNYLILERAWNQYHGEEDKNVFIH